MFSPALDLDCDGLGLADTTSSLEDAVKLRKIRAVRALEVKYCAWRDARNARLTQLLAMWRDDDAAQMEKLQKKAIGLVICASPRRGRRLSCPEDNKALHEVLQRVDELASVTDVQRKVALMTVYKSRLDAEARVARQLPWQERVGGRGRGSGMFGGAKLSMAFTASVFKLGVLSRVLPTKDEALAMGLLADARIVRETVMQKNVRPHGAVMHGNTSVDTRDGEAPAPTTAATARVHLTVDVDADDHGTGEPEHEARHVHELSPWQRNDARCWSMYLIDIIPAVPKVKKSGLPRLSPPPSTDPSPRAAPPFRAVGFGSEDAGDDAFPSPRAVLSEGGASDDIARRGDGSDDGGGGGDYPRGSPVKASRWRKIQDAVGPGTSGGSTRGSGTTTRRPSLGVGDPSRSASGGVPVRRGSVSRRESFSSHPSLHAAAASSDHLASPRVTPRLARRRSSIGADSAMSSPRSSPPPGLVADNHRPHSALPISHGQARRGSAQAALPAAALSARGARRPSLSGGAPSPRRSSVSAHDASVDRSRSPFLSGAQRRPSVGLAQPRLLRRRSSNTVADAAAAAAAAGSFALRNAPAGAGAGDDDHPVSARLSMKALAPIACEKKRPLAPLPGQTAQRAMAAYLRREQMGVTPDG